MTVHCDVPGGEFDDAAGMAAADDGRCEPDAELCVSDAELCVSDAEFCVPEGELYGPDAEPRSIPDATVARLAVYLRVLGGMDDLGIATVSSEELANAAGVNSAKLRKDLSHVGSYGVRGVGYAVRTLVQELASTLGLEQSRSVVLIGVGNLGQALAGYAGFGSRGFRIAALLDADPARVGSTLRGLTVRHIDELAEVVRAEGISIAVIATPAGVAQAVCDRLAAAGVTSILNFAPTVLSVPDHVDVRKVDLAAELQILSFHEQRKARDLATSRRQAVSS